LFDLVSGERTAGARRQPTPLIVGGILALVAIGVGVFVFSGGRDGPIGHVIDQIEEEPKTPAFSFELRKVAMIATSHSAKRERMQEAAEATAERVDAVLDGLYTGAYLDPEAWGSGDYSAVMEAFAEDARGHADEAEAILTAGPEAGASFDKIVPRPSALIVKVLMGPDGKPASAVGIVRFAAEGSGESGPTVLFRSDGQYFLERQGTEWKIVSFDVLRTDREKATGGSSPAATPSPTEVSPT
jgi:hypothetical protein